MFNRAVCLMSRVFANGQGDRGSIPDSKNGAFVALLNSVL